MLNAALTSAKCFSAPCHQPTAEPEVSSALGCCSVKAAIVNALVKYGRHHCGQNRTYKWSPWSGSPQYQPLGQPRTIRFWTICSHLKIKSYKPEMCRNKKKQGKNLKNKCGKKGGWLTRLQDLASPCPALAPQGCVLSPFHLGLQ